MAGPSAGAVLRALAGTAGGPAPSCDQLQRWLPTCPRAAWSEAAPLLQAVRPKGGVLLVLLADVLAAGAARRGPRARPGEVIVSGPSAEVRASGWSLAADVAEVHRRWAGMGAGRPRPHPLLPLVEGWQAAQRRGPDRAVVAQRRGMTKRAKLAAALAAAPWRELGLTAAYVDGQPLAAKIGQPVREFGPARGPLGFRTPQALLQAKVDWRLAALSTLAPQGAGRSALVADALNVMSLAHAVRGSLEVDEWQGAALLARTKDGGWREPQASDVKRWHRAAGLLGSAYLVTNEELGRWASIATVQGLGDGRIVLGRPLWAREALAGRMGGWQLTAESGQAARARAAAGASASAAGRVVTALETWLGSTLDGGRRAAALRAVKGGGGAGRYYFLTWRDCMALAGFWWDWADRLPSKTGEDDRMSKRWAKVVRRLQAAGYVLPVRRGRPNLRAEAPAGDSVEVVEVLRGRRGQVGGLRFRAAARFVAAAAAMSKGPRAKGGGLRDVSLAEWQGRG